MTPVNEGDISSGHLGQMYFSEIPLVLYVRFQARNSLCFACQTYFLSEDSFFSIKARKTLC